MAINIGKFLQFHNFIIQGFLMNYILLVLFGWKVLFICLDLQILYYFLFSVLFQENQIFICIMNDAYNNLRTNWIGILMSHLRLLKFMRAIHLKSYPRIMKR